MSDPRTTRYADDWNGYSAHWDAQFGDRYAHLGDEWCTDGSELRLWERRLFQLAELWIQPQSRVLEIGCGGGKWTVRLAPRVGAVTVFDVAQAMLDRTRARCEAAGLANVSYVLGNGLDMAALADRAFDFVWSYDVFVHITLEDTVAYLAEIARVLRPGGVAVIHHAANDNSQAWDGIEVKNDWYRTPGHTLGQFYYHSREALDRLYTRAGLRVRTVWAENGCVVLTAERPAGSLAVTIEGGLRHLAQAGDDQTMRQAIGQLEAAAGELGRQLATLLDEARRTTPGRDRYAAVQKIRGLLRG